MINHKLEKLLRIAQDAPNGNILHLADFDSSTSKRQYFTLGEVEVLATQLVQQMLIHFVYLTNHADDSEQRIEKTFQEFDDYRALDIVDRFACLLQMLEELEEYETTDPGADADWGPHADALVKLGQDIRQMETEANLSNLERMKKKSDLYIRLQAKTMTNRLLDELGDAPPESKPNQ